MHSYEPGRSADPSTSVGMNKPVKVQTGDQINFPHLAKNEPDMGHPHLWLDESFETCSFFPHCHRESFARDDKGGSGRSCEWEGENKPQVSPLRYAPVETTKLGRPRLYLSQG